MRIGLKIFKQVRFFATLRMTERGRDSSPHAGNDNEKQTNVKNQSNRDRR